MEASLHRLAAAYASLLDAADAVTARERIADAFQGIVPSGALVVYAVDERDGSLVPSARRGLVDDGAGSCLSLPLVAHGELVGVVDLVRHGGQAVFSNHELDLAAALADGAAMALENALARQRLEVLAQTDPLTGLFNHRHFYDRLEGELARARRSGEPISLVVVDIDDFKRINDIYGHGVGDSVIVGLGRLLRSAVRVSDVVCRVGGEEFAVLMPSCDAEGALVFCARLTELLRDAPFDEVGFVTVSAGIAIGPAHAASPRGLFGCADGAMRTAKARGKDRSVVWEDDGTAELPGTTSREMRSLAHMKTLQSLAGRINWLREVDEIGEAIVQELRLLLAYHACRIYVVEEGSLRLAAAGASGCSRCATVAEAPRLFSAGEVGGELVAGAAATRRSKLHVRQHACDPALTESVAVVPLTHGIEALGAIEVLKIGEDSLDADDLRLLEVLAAQASVAFANARLYDDLRREADQAKALVRFGDLIAAGTSLADLLDRVVAGAVGEVGAQRASVWLPVDDGTLQLGATHGHRPGPFTDAELAATAVVLGQALPILDPVAPLPVSVCSLSGSRDATMVLAPLQLQPGRVGALALVISHEGVSETQLRLVSGIASNARLAIAKAAELDELRATQRGAVGAPAPARGGLSRVA